MFKVIFVFCLFSFFLELVHEWTRMHTNWIFKLKLKNLNLVFRLNNTSEVNIDKHSFVLIHEIRGQKIKRVTNARESLQVTRGTKDEEVRKQEKKNKKLRISKVFLYAMEEVAWVFAIGCGYLF